MLLLMTSLADRNLFLAKQSKLNQTLRNAPATRNLIVSRFKRICEIYVIGQVLAVYVVNSYRPSIYKSTNGEFLIA